MDARKYVGLILLILWTLSACQASPEKSVVVSKNDGSFDVRVVQSAETVSSDKSVESASSPNSEFQHKSAFSSTDGTVSFTMNIQLPASSFPSPVVEVAPHFLTEEDVKRVGQLLFGDALFYEAEPLGTDIYSKQEIQEKLQRWTPYAGESPVIDSFLEKYALLLESAPEENPHQQCTWTYRKFSYYYFGDESAEDPAGDNDEISTTVRVNGIPYSYIATTRNKQDFKLNFISAKPYDGASPQGIDYEIFQKCLCDPEKPDDSEIAVVQEKAESILKEMKMGDWVVDECYAESTREGYVIHVNAVPSFLGAEALRADQLINLKSEKAYASNYYYTDAQFQFNSKGDLISFLLNSPLDVVETVNSNAKVLPLEQLMQQAEENFSLTDYYAYDREGNIPYSKDPLHCNVQIGRAEYGLFRVKVPNTDERYYYVPAITFWGNIQFENLSNGDIYPLNVGSEYGFSLLTLNAVDGSIIITEYE